MGKVILGVFIGIGLLMLIGITVSTKQSNSAGSQSSGTIVEGSDNAAAVRPVIVVSAVKLWSDYQANEVAADNAYRGKRLAVRGQVSSIKKDFLDKTYLSLVTPNEFMEVHANLKDEYVSEAAHLSRGQLISLECEGSGMVIGSPILKDCSIQQDTLSRADTNSGLTAQSEAQEPQNKVGTAKPVVFPSAKVAQLMQQEEVLNDKCRGGAGDDNATQTACVDREAMLDLIKAQGWCWGHEGQIGADKDWEYCAPLSQ